MLEWKEMGKKSQVDLENGSTRYNRIYIRKRVTDMVTVFKEERIMRKILVYEKKEI